MFIRFSRAFCAYLCAVALLLSETAVAEHVVVKRVVVFHEGSARSTASIGYSKPGDEFQLLDDSARASGYYHSTSGRRDRVTVHVADKVKMFSDFTLDKAVYATGWDDDVTVTADAAGHITVSSAQ